MLGQMVGLLSFLRNFHAVFHSCCGNPKHHFEIRLMIEVLCKNKQKKNHSSSIKRNSQKQSFLDTPGISKGMVFLTLATLEAFRI